jgi:hypothetical protein
MTENHTGRAPRASRRQMLVLALALLVPLAIASPAAATEHHPTGQYAPFADCPLSNPAVEICTIANTTSGEFTVGKKTVPISETIVLQGALKEVPGTEEDELLAAENGNTLSKTPQLVPGGLLGVEAPSWWPGFLKKLYHEDIEKGLTGVMATTELAKPPSAVRLSTSPLIFGENKTALKLPIKVKLENAFLGGECYIGSSSEPITLNLTTGTTSPPGPNTPIKGYPGTLQILNGGNLLVLSDNSLVDNSFAAPEATGCGGILLSWAVDPLVDEILGAPSAAGKNTAILNGTLEEATAEAVKASE